MPFQSQSWESVVFLALAGAPAAGLAHSDVTLEYRKTSTSAFEEKELEAEDWVNLGGGYYAIRWAAEEMSNVGSFFFKIEGNDFDTIGMELKIEPTPLAFLVTPEVCVVSGNVINIGGQVGQNSVIHFRVPRVPLRVGSSLLDSEIIRTYPDALGNFSVQLLRGATVLVEMTQSGIKNQIVVPDQQTAQILDLLPPISNSI